MRKPALLVLVMLLASSGCSKPTAREYELRGQVLAVDAARSEITVKHEDITGFMPGMTMPFKVKDGKLLEGRAPGDLVRATLVVDDTEAYLKTIQPTGHAPLTEAAPPPRVDPLNVGEAVPDAALIDQDSRPHKLSGWRGRPIAITFIYTRCPLPDFCPLLDRHFNAAQSEVIKDAALRGKVHLLSVSFDPAFDTPAVLSAHARKVGADASTWTFLTGDQKEIDALASRFGVSTMRDGANAAEVVHNLRTAVIGKDGRLRKVFNGIQWAPSELVAELRNAVDAR